MTAELVAHERCRGPGTCHSVLWCDRCGDVDESCDNPECDLHWPLHHPELAIELIADAMARGHDLRYILDMGQWVSPGWLIRAVDEIDVDAAMRRATNMLAADFAGQLRTLLAEHPPSPT